MRRVLLETIEANYVSSCDVGKTIYSKKELEKFPFSLYQEILSLEWLRKKHYKIIRETSLKQSHESWPGHEYSIQYYIEFDEEEDAFEFSLRYNNKLAI